MARLDDYLPKDGDDIQGEIDNAVKGTEERQTQQPEIPERFHGKSLEEVVQSYTELEKLNSRQSLDLGEMRKYADTLVRQSLESNAAATPPEEVKPVTVDDLYEDPEKAIERVIETKFKPQLEAQAKQLAEQTQNRRLAEMDAEYDGWRDTVQSPEFNQWIDGSGYRQRMAASVREGNDLDAANDLLAQYYDQQGANKQAKEQQRKQQLADASLETGGAAYSEPKTTFSRKELMNVRIRAKQGDRNADAWLRDNHSSIATAYEQGRVVD